MLSQNPYVLLSANAISGVASSMWISFTILNSLYYEPHELSRSIGSINAVNNAGILAAYLLGGLFYQRFGMVLMFWMSLISGAIATVLALFIVDEPPKPQPHARAPAPPRRRAKAADRLLAVGGAVSVHRLCHVQLHSPTP